MQKCVCKASLCVTACCFHTSIIGCETERNRLAFVWQLHGLSSSYWSPNARVCTAAAVTSPRYDQLTLILPSDGYHCGICTHRFSVTFAWVFRVSKCYRLIFTLHATAWYKQQSFELQIGIKKTCMIQTMTLMPVEIKEMSSNVNLPPPCFENVRKLAKIAQFQVSNKVLFLRMEGWVCVTVKELSHRV